MTKTVGVIIPPGARRHDFERAQELVTSFNSLAGETSRIDGIDELAYTRHLLLDGSTYRAFGATVQVNGPVTLFYARRTQIPGNHNMVAEPFIRYALMAYAEKVGFKVGEHNPSNHGFAARNGVAFRPLELELSIPHGREQHDMIGDSFDSIRQFDEAIQDYWTAQGGRMYINERFK
jgi:hypothetical protein